MLAYAIYTLGSKITSSINVLMVKANVQSIKLVKLSGNVVVVVSETDVMVVLDELTMVMGYSETTSLLLV